jgi:hypothetical protein
MAAARPTPHGTGFSEQVSHNYSGASCQKSKLTEQEVGESEYPRARHGSAC